MFVSAFQHQAIPGVLTYRTLSVRLQPNHPYFGPSAVLHLPIHHDAVRMWFGCGLDVVWMSHHVSFTFIASSIRSVPVRAHCTCTPYNVEVAAVGPLRGVQAPRHFLAWWGLRAGLPPNRVSLSGSQYAMWNRVILSQILQ